MRHLLVFLGFSLAALTVSAYVFEKAANGAPLEWNGASIPIAILADNSVVLSDGNTRATCIRSAMIDPSRGWNPQLGGIQFAPTISSGSGYANNGLNEVFFSSQVYNDAWDPNALAVTAVWFEGEQIVESDILF